MAAQTIFGQSDALALAVVAWINSQTSPFALKVAPERRFARKVDLPDIPTYSDPVSVQVFPGAEVTERPPEMRSFASTYALHILMQQQVSGAPDAEAQCALLCQVRSEIVEGLKKYGPIPVANCVPAFGSPGAVLIHGKSADGELYDLKKLESEHVFSSETILLFKAAG